QLHRRSSDTRGRVARRSPHRSARPVCCRAGTSDTATCGRSLCATRGVWQNSAMFDVVVTPAVLRQLRQLRRTDSVRIVDAIESHLHHEPERPTRTGIKRLRAQQDATYRLRVGDFRVFYDVEGRTVTVVAVLHKRETEAFYRKE